MSPNEVVILMSFNEKEALGVQQLAHVTDIRGAFLRYICNAMCLHGYLERKNPEGYQATWKGKKAIFEALHKN